MNDNAINTAARFGEIPFTEFTKDLVTGVFDSLVDAHIDQMEEYSDLVNALSQSLSTYINNTQDDVSFEEISDFVLNYPLPEINSSDLATVLGSLESPVSTSTPAPAPQTSAGPPTVNNWWQGLFDSLAPAIGDLVDKIPDPNLVPALQAVNDYNTITTASIPDYQSIRDAIAGLISSNKYALFQTMVRQGAMRLVVTEGEIETKITFSTWNTHEKGSERTIKQKEKDLKRTKTKRSRLVRLFKGKKNVKKVNRVVTVNTAKPHHRDTSGTRIDIFGRVLIRFKTDYAPLNG